MRVSVVDGPLGYGLSPRALHLFDCTLTCGSSQMHHGHIGFPSDNVGCVRVTKLIFDLAVNVCYPFDVVDFNWRDVKLGIGLSS